MATGQVQQSLFAQATQHTSAALSELYALIGMAADDDDFTLREALQAKHDQLSVVHRGLMKLESHYTGMASTKNH